MRRAPPGVTCTKKQEAYREPSVAGQPCKSVSPACDTSSSARAILLNLMVASW